MVEIYVLVLSLGMGNPMKLSDKFSVHVFLTHAKNPFAVDE
jgi:hypothetical protein